MDKIEELLNRGVANIIPSRKALEDKLKSEERLNAYLGIDPTATKIHLGHAVPLRKLQQFAELGHNVIFLIGDFTALIGDTSDKESERLVLTSEEIEENFKTYKKQAEKILDFSKIKVRYNSEWLDNLSFKDVVKLAQEFSFGDFGSRELIKKRLSSGKIVGLHKVFTLRCKDTIATLWIPMFKSGEPIRLLTCRRAEFFRRTGEKKNLIFLLRNFCLEPTAAK